MSDDDTRNASTPAYDIDDSFDRTSVIGNARRVVVKVGTRILSQADNSLDEKFIDGLMTQVAFARSRGIQVAIVSSGAVGAGMGNMGLTERPTRIDLLQGLAGIGQTVLMHRYKTAARGRGMRVGQVLLTANDLSRKRDYMHVQSALRALFELDAIPVINENDSVAIDELRFGDNDSLSAHVANMIDADLLVILTDREGLHEGSPDTDPPPPVIRTVHRIDNTIEGFCAVGGSGIGGMKTKLDAARTLGASGIPTIIAHGRTASLDAIVSGDPVGSLFVPQTTGTRGHNRWILARKVYGTLIVDDGAASALIDRGKSLLPSGIKAVEGRFQSGDAVRVVQQGIGELARGLVMYSSTDVRKLAGRQTKEIQDLLGTYSGDEIVHRDNLVMVMNGAQ
jgi:glutamate 5-kinase